MLPTAAKRWLPYATATRIAAAAAATTIIGRRKCSLRHLRTLLCCRTCICCDSFSRKNTAVTHLSFSFSVCCDHSGMCLSGTSEFVDALILQTRVSLCHLRMLLRCLTCICCDSFSRKHKAVTHLSFSFSVCCDHSGMCVSGTSEFVDASILQTRVSLCHLRTLLHCLTCICCDGFSRKNTAVTHLSLSFSVCCDHSGMCVSGTSEFVDALILQTRVSLCHLRTLLRCLTCICCDSFSRKHKAVTHLSFSFSVCCDHSGMCVSGTSEFVDASILQTRVSLCHLRTLLRCLTCICCDGFSRKNTAVTHMSFSFSVCCDHSGMCVSGMLEFVDASILQTRISLCHQLRTLLCCLTTCISCDSFSRKNTSVTNMLFSFSVCFNHSLFLFASIIQEYAWADRWSSSR